MSSVLSYIKYLLELSDKTYCINDNTKYLILWSPIFGIVLCAFFFMIPSTQNAMLLLMKENHEVELMTFFVSLIAGLLGLLFTFRLKANRESQWLIRFYMLFSIGLIVIAMEEIAWGQKFIGFKTPEIWQSINQQGETTLHNIWPLQGKTEILRFILGFGGLLGMICLGHTNFQKIGVPVILFPWFGVILIHSVMDLLNDFKPIQSQFDNYVNQTSELIELYIVISALLYILLNWKKLLIDSKLNLNLDKSSKIEKTRK